MRGMAPVLLALGLTCVVAACGSPEDQCQGIICSNCAASGDCNIQCAAGEVQYCGNFGYFDDPDLRCAYCGNP